MTREELVEQIVMIIQENVDPIDGWRDMGGMQSGTIQELNGNLIVTQTPTNHREIKGLLAQLREIKDLQINVETRVLEVATNWFERIGIDLDLYFNTNNTMFQAAKAVDPNFQLSDFFNPGQGMPKNPIIFGGFDDVFDEDGNLNFPFNTVPTGNMVGIPVDNDGDGIPESIVYGIGGVGSPIGNQGGWSPIGAQQGSFGLTELLADFAEGSFAGTAMSNPALAVGIQFLDDIQVDLLIEATQADRRAIVLNAPRLTFFNNAEAWIAVATGTTFVSDLQLIVGEGGIGFRPIPDRVFEGFVLRVHGVASADRRYVNLVVYFDSAQLVEMRTATTRAQASSTGFGGGAGLPFEGDFELPVLSGQNIRTAVSVPDKGTLLLGGARTVHEIEVESGVPVLSKIPIVNRFFTNRVTSKDERSLLILIRPEIIIQQENEDLLFPGLTDTLQGGAAYLR